MKEFVQEWLPILTPFILAALTGIIFPLIRAWLAKIKDERLRGFALDAVRQAEEIARKAKDKPESNVKHAMAKNKLVELAGKAGIVLSDGTADMLIESTLGMLTLEGKR